MAPKDPDRLTVEELVEDEPRRHPFIWVFALLCLFFSVPFYYPEGRDPVLIYGLPDWCWVTLAADLLLAATVVHLILRTWSEPKGDR